MFYLLVKLLVGFVHHLTRVNIGFVSTFKVFLTLWISLIFFLSHIEIIQSVLLDFSRKYNRNFSVMSCHRGL